MRRFEDWPLRLDIFLKDAQERTFRWGTWDCALLAAAGVFALTGEDFAAPFRGHYKTARGSVMALNKYGHGDIVATATAFLGQPLSILQKVQRGDVVAFETEYGPALGIVDLSGSQFVAVQEGEGLVRLPVSLAICGWRV